MIGNGYWSVRYEKDAAVQSSNPNESKRWVFTVQASGISTKEAFGQWFGSMAQGLGADTAGIKKQMAEWAQGSSQSAGFYGGLFQAMMKLADGAGAKETAKKPHISSAATPDQAQPASPPAPPASSAAEEEEPLDPKIAAMVARQVAKGKVR